MSNERTPDRPSVRMHQTHDASGSPATAEFLQVLPPSPLLLHTGAAAMDFLAPLNPSRTDREFAFFYSDPARGSGWLELESFSDADARRVQNNVWMEEIERAVGRQPRKNPDMRVPHGVVPRYNNPWFFVALGLMPFGAGLYVFVTRSIHPDVMVLGTVMSLMLMALGAALIFVNVRKRVPWWHRARRYARETGKMHPDLVVWS